MFRHQGKTRTPKHNVRIAVFLSFTAGLVNITGFYAVHILTTNVTGHFATLIRNVYDFEWKMVLTFVLFLVSFLFGSFTSSTLIEWMSLRKKVNVYLYPTLLESSVLITIPLLADYSNILSANQIACLLLFAMGVQNAFVTKISNAVVRTTHLTGLFTDLGIEISQLLFSTRKYMFRQNISTIKLRLNIILFFFMGGIFGGFMYSKIKLNVLLIAAFILLVGLILDNIRFFVIRISRKHKGKVNILNKKRS